MSKTRLRIRFTKTGDLRWISHRDLARVWERLLRRAGLQLAFSEGFHPKPKISFPTALALGIEALDEVVELEIVGEFDLAEIQAGIVKQLPEGMELLELLPLKTGIGKARFIAASYRAKLPQELIETTTAAAEKLRGRETVEIKRDEKTIVCSTQDPNFDVRVHDGYLLFSLPAIAQGSIRPLELLTCLGLSHLLEDGTLLQRTQVLLGEPLKSGTAANSESSQSVQTAPEVTVEGESF
jgi:radical SAM-linked protein